MITINLRPGGRRAAPRRTPTLAGVSERFRAMNVSDREPWHLIAIGAWAVVIIGLGFFFITTSNQLGALEPELEATRDEYTRYQGFLREKRDAETIRDSILGQIVTISGVDQDRYVWSHILDEVSGAMPDFTWLTGISQIAAAPNALEDLEAGPPPVSVRIAGMTGDLQNYTAFLRRLEASPWLVNVLPLEWEDGRPSVVLP